jgi:hypothetical protein
MQVSAKQENVNVIQNHEKARDHQLLLKKVQELKDREEL